ncbi:MAG: hypothetical protein WCL54_02945 [Clostridia bacterium]
MKKRVKLGLVIGLLILLSSIGTSGSITHAVATKSTLSIQYTAKKFTLVTGKAKIAFRSSIKQAVTVRIYNSHKKIVAVLPRFVTVAKAVRNVYWNGRKRLEDGKGYGDYVAAGFYRAKVSGTKSSAYSGSFQVLAGAKQRLTKVAVSTQGFVGESTARVAFCVQRKHDVAIRLFNHHGKLAFLKTMRDVLPKKTIRMTLSGRASAENELGLKDNALLPVGTYTVKISSGGTSTVRKMRLMQHFSPINQFNIIQDQSKLIASWKCVAGATGYELRVRCTVDGKSKTLKEGMGTVGGSMVCDVSSVLAVVGQYQIEVYAIGDSFHPLTKVGTFAYSVFGTLTSPQQLMFLENDGVISAYCNPVSNADSYEVTVNLNGVLVKTFEIFGVSKVDISQAFRENGYGTYTFGMKAKCKKNPCYADSGVTTGDPYVFKGFKTPLDLTVVKDGDGNYTAHWSAVEGVSYYVVYLYIKGEREAVIVCGWNKATLTAYVPAKGEKYEIVIYSLGNEVHGESLPSEKQVFTA